ncbi:MAG: hypothetical protein IT447_02895 [Phycisphaerales bacterium]|jgi:hypothetical protein|nr:hypothetical protein [Phycisphaerales bacterium]
MTYATDTDLLYWEPTIFKSAQAVSQQLLSGTGNLAATTFTLTVGSLAGLPVNPQHVLTLDGSIEGCYPIISVDSSTTLTISTLYDNLFPDSNAPAPCPIGTATGLTFAIRTFWPLLELTTQWLNSAAGLDGITVLNPSALRIPCALGTLNLIYTALAANAVDPDPLIIRADLYKQILLQSLRRCTLELDTNADGQIDDLRSLSTLKFLRA